MVELALEAQFGVDEARQLHRHVQAEAGTAGMAGTVVFRSEEFIVDPRLVAFADADASVFDSERDIAGFLRNIDRYTTLFGIFDGVSDKILQCFF